MTTENSTSTDKLRDYVASYERLEAQKQEYAEMQKEQKAKMKSEGYDVAAFNAVIARRKKDRDAVADLDATVDLYEAQLGG